jgi:hypothetical protein
MFVMPSLFCHQPNRFAHTKIVPASEGGVTNIRACTCVNMESTEVLSRYAQNNSWLTAAEWGLPIRSKSSFLLGQAPPQE